jgi:hypothetical protein
MSAATLLDQAAHVQRDRQATYGDASKAMAAIAARWSLTLGHPVTAAEVVLCMMDLKLTRLTRDPGHQDSILDLVGYAAILHEVTK